MQIAKGGCSGLQYEMSLDEKKADDAIVERDGVEFFVDGKCDVFEGRHSRFSGRI